MKTKGRKSKADSPELSGSMGAYGAEGDDLPTKPLETRKRAVGSIPTLSTPTRLIEDFLNQLLGSASIDERNCINHFGRNSYFGRLTRLRVKVIAKKFPGIKLQQTMEYRIKP